MADRFRHYLKLEEELKCYQLSLKILVLKILVDPVVHLQLCYALLQFLVVVFQCISSFSNMPCAILVLSESVSVCSIWAAYYRHAPPPPRVIR